MYAYLIILCYAQLSEGIHLKLHTLVAPSVSYPIIMIMLIILILLIIILIQLFIIIILKIND